MMKEDLYKYYSQNPLTTLDPFTETNALNYKFAMPDVSLNHIYSVSQSQGNNIVWDEER